MPVDEVEVAIIDNKIDITTISNNYSKNSDCNNIVLVTDSNKHNIFNNWVRTIVIITVIPLLLRVVTVMLTLLKNIFKATTIEKKK
jgi:hypothetical protein